MKRFCIYLFLLFSTLGQGIKGQDRPTDAGKMLQFLFNRLSNNINDDSRLQINDSINLIINSYVRSDSVFFHRFKNLKYLGQITASDSLLKIVTWNLVLYNNPGMYFCYLIRKSEPGKQNLVYSLTTSYKAQKVKTDTTYTDSDWYGALYYDLKSYVISGNRCWVILGLDYGNPLITRKIIDVLDFTNQNTLFGRKWFDNNDRMKYREVFEYASTGMMTLRFASDKLIVFDHLVPLSSPDKEDHQYFGPDYSYDAYKFENGIWKFFLNADVRNIEK